MTKHRVTELTVGAYVFHGYALGVAGELLKEIEIHKSQPRMEFDFGGKFEVVSYNKQSYYRFEFPDEIYWYRRTSDETCLELKLLPSS